MSSEEAAASLFGPEDSSSDPFSAFGTESNQEASDDLFPGITNADSAHSAATDPFDNLGEHSTYQGETVNIGYNQPAVHEHDDASGLYASAYNGNGTSEAYRANGGTGQWDNNRPYYSAVDKGDFFNINSH